MTRIAVYPGSFDPITSGHLNIIRRSATLFDKLIVVVMTNYKKLSSYSFSIDERVDLIKRCTEDLENVTVDCSVGLLADYAKEKNASFIVKGLRAVSDFEDEFQQALINKRLCDGIETVFLPRRFGTHVPFIGYDKTNLPAGGRHYTVSSIGCCR